MATTFKQESLDLHPCTNGKILQEKYDFLYTYH